MRLAGVSATSFFRTGILAVLFILLLKFVAVKSGSPGFASLAGAI